MDLKQAHSELRALALELSNVPVPEAVDLSSRLFDASVHLAEMPSDEDPDEDPEKAAVAYIDSEMEALPKKRAWWLPPRNFLINQALTGYNLYEFTVLPYFPKNTAYREDLAGIVIHPIWRPIEGDFFRTIDLDLAKKLIGYARKAPTVQDTVRKELDWIERTFSIRIPEAVQGKILKDVLPTAKRRWGVDRLRVKNQLVPLDGSAPRDL